MAREPRQPRPPTAKPPPAAHLRVEPTRAESGAARGYLITLELELREAVATSTAEALSRVREIAAGAMGGVHSSTSTTEDPVARDSAAPQATGVAGTVTVVTSAACGGWPASTTIAGIRAELMRHGYEVTTIERRGCAEPGCSSEHLVSPGRRDERVQDWFSAEICGRHDYRICPHCASLLRLTSTSAAGPAPTVNCPVCQVRLVEWGGSKLWQVELVTRSA